MYRFTHNTEYLSVFPEIIDTIVTYSLIASECILHFTAIIQPLLFHDQFVKLYRKYVTIQRFITFRLAHRMSFVKFKTMYDCLAVIVLIPFALTLIVRKSIHEDAAIHVLENDLISNGSAICLYFGAFAYDHSRKFLEFCPYVFNETAERSSTKSSGFEHTTDIRIVSGNSEHEYH